MDRVVYQRMSELEDAHWWFSARRLMIQTILGRLVTLPDDPKILEAGCGTGGNLKLLQSFGATDAFEFDASARQFATEKLRMPVPFGALPDTIPFARNTDPPPLKWSSAMFRKTEETHGKQATQARRDCHKVTAG